MIRCLFLECLCLGHQKQHLRLCECPLGTTVVSLQELSRRGLAKADIETGLHAVFGSDPNSVQLCPPGAEECDLDDAAHEPERVHPGLTVQFDVSSQRRVAASVICICSRPVWEAGNIVRKHIQLLSRTVCIPCLTTHVGQARSSTTCVFACIAFVCSLVLWPGVCVTCTGSPRRSGSTALGGRTAAGASEPGLAAGDAAEAAGGVAAAAWTHLGHCVCAAAGAPSVALFVWQ